MYSLSTALRQVVLCVVSTCELTRPLFPPGCPLTDESPAEQKVERVPGYHQQNGWHCEWSV